MPKGKSNIVAALKEMNKVDIYSFMLFALYELRKIEEYRVLSELSYILDNQSIINFLDYYGGMTIKVPTKEDFRLIINALLLYQYINIENMSFEEAIKQLDKNKNDIVKIKEAYKVISPLLENYEFKRN